MDRQTYAFRIIQEFSGIIRNNWYCIYLLSLYIREKGILRLQVLPIWLIPAYSEIFHIIYVLSFYPAQ